MDSFGFSLAPFIVCIYIYSLLLSCYLYVRYIIIRHFFSPQQFAFLLSLSSPNSKTISKIYLP
jgi:hypothetical protein